MTPEFIEEVSKLTRQIVKLEEALKSSQLEINRLTKERNTFKSKYTDLCCRIAEISVSHNVRDNTYVVQVNFPPFMTTEDLEVAVAAHFISSAAEMNRKGKTNV